MQLPALVFGALASILVIVVADEPSKNRLGNINENDVLRALHREYKARSRSMVEGIEPPRLKALHDDLSSMYAALPKNEDGRLDRQVVRYALHRFFVQRHGWFIRGLEPTRGEDKADLEHHTSDQLREWVPLFLQDVFEKKLKHKGVSLGDLVMLAATLEDIVRSEAHERLLTVFRNQNVSKEATLSKDQAEDFLTTYYVEFLRTNDLEFRRLAGEAPSASDVSEKATWIGAYPHWGRDLKWLRSLLDKLDAFNFQSLSNVTDMIGETFPSYNDKECTELEDVLHDMEGARLGRVPLSKFYATKHNGWKFTEKKEYLQSLGLLDETDEKRSYLITTNYRLSRHNCFAPSDVYVVCCRSGCDYLMSELEKHLGESTATPRQIASIVAKLSARKAIAPPALSTELMSRLDHVAEVNGGRVPLHGRLFAQWMHHAYPHECMYPHQSGSVNPHTPSEWLNKTGEGVHATEEELQRHINDDICAVGSTGGADCSENTELPWDSQEELLLSSSRGGIAQSQFAASDKWQRTLARMLKAGVAMLTLGCFWLVSKLRKGQNIRLSLVLASRQPQQGLLGLLALAAYVYGLLNDGLLLCICIFGCMATGSQKVISQCMVSEPHLHKLV